MKRQRLLPYRQAVPAILLFQLITEFVLQLWMFGFSRLSMLLLASTGRVAVTSGDFLFIFTSWQGLLLLLLALVTLFLFTALDVNALVILCGRLLRGEKPSVLLCVKEGLLSLRRILNPRGLLIVLYVALLSPVIGFEMVISLTRNFYIPKFISSVIRSNPLYSAGAVLLGTALFAVGVLFIFVLHGTLLDGMTLKESGRNSLRLIKRNRKKFVAEILRFLLVVFTVFAVFSAFAVLVSVLSETLSVPSEILIPLTVFLLSCLLSVSFTLFVMMMPFVTLKITALYLTFQSGGEWRYEKRKNRKSPLVIAAVAVTAMFIGLSTVLISAFYDDFFPKKVTVSCIGHRAGGSEAPENTVAGLDAAYALGATGGELDIQRTSDGYYVVNHDDDFGRTAGVKRRPSDMTLEEVRQLRVDGEPVPTLEEMLEAARGRLTLYVELKGATADRQMADDAVRIVREYRMEDSVVIISLKYDLIDYIETTWPEMNTGYLAFASFGDTASLNCDYLALEEEAATSETIDSIHSKGKKVLVWTVNDEEDLRAFLRSEADALITDELSAAREITREMESASPIERIVDGVFRMYSFRNA